MTERKTRSMLQRVPVILAVTAASYGLQLPPAFGRPAAGAAAVEPQLDRGETDPASARAAHRSAAGSQANDSLAR